MKEQLYFKREDSEICHDKTYFDWYMEEEGLKEIEVYIGIREKFSGVFWCKHDCFCGDDTMNSCGKQCRAYEPRNGKSGCCRYHTNYMYSKGEKVILTL